VLEVLSRLPPSGDDRDEGRSCSATSNPGDLGRDGLVSVMVSITSLDPTSSARCEPRAASAEERLRIIEALATAGIPVGVFVARSSRSSRPRAEDIVTLPRMPVQSARNYVLYASPQVKNTVPGMARGAHPLRAQHVMSVIASMRMAGTTIRLRQPHARTGPFAELLRARFRSPASGQRHERAPEVEYAAVPTAQADTGQLSLAL